MRNQSVSGKYVPPSLAEMHLVSFACSTTRWSTIFLAVFTVVGIPYRSLAIIHVGDISAGETTTQCHAVEATESVFGGCPFIGTRNSPCIPGSSCFDFNELTDECLGPDEQGEGFFGQCCDHNQQCSPSKLFRWTSYKTVVSFRLQVVMSHVQ